MAKWQFEVPFRLLVHTNSGKTKTMKTLPGAASAIFSVAYALGHHTTAILKSESARGGQKATKTCQNLLSSGTRNYVL